MQPCAGSRIGIAALYVAFPHQVKSKGCPGPDDQNKVESFDDAIGCFESWASLAINHPLNHRNVDPTHLSPRRTR